jgi:hypothetical protein
MEIIEKMDESNLNIKAKNIMQNFRVKNVLNESFISENIT